MTSPTRPEVLTLPLQEKLIIIGKSLLLVLLIYTVIDLYEPIKKVLAGGSVTGAEVLSHIEVLEKWPIVAIITLLMANTSIKKKTKALQEAQLSSPETAGQEVAGK
ncbi:hypothetical protein GU926_14850 [Nibribacter ruber]|uniref:Uncharacterized protein n=1 Tax=Nibribacter ruber TaxID=2698458 RepID=A0A6P1P2K6_9BACT|nr:hypothetical protein [Nibribacter ruber]QHL88637.1 hypothetical protein GU926_14850 [Nibribacter ruber]